MSWVYLDLPLTITARGPLHLGTGYDWGLVQRTVVRDAQQNVYIPGSSLKGKVRHVCENLARLAGLTVCGAPRPEMMCGRDVNNYCLVCRVFGAPGGNIPDGRELYWQDAPLTDEWRKEMSRWPMGQVIARTQIQLSRARGIAVENRLYTSEFTTPGLAFAGRVSGWLRATPCSADRGYYEVNLLLAGLQMVETLGGGHSRGAGQCQITLPGEVLLRIEGQDTPQAYPLADLLEAAVSLGLFSDEDRNG